MTEFKRIMVPLDGSPLSETALPVAMALAQKFGSQIILLRVLDLPPAISGFWTEELPRWMTEAREHIHQAVKKYLQIQQDRLRDQGFDVQVLVRETSPAEDIIDAALVDGVDLIVMSTHGRGGLARWTFGSVADKVIRHSPCPVLLIRQSPENESKFKSILSSSEHPQIGGEPPLQFGSRLPTLKEVRVLLIEEAMRRANRNQSVAAQLLGITRQGLNKYLKALEAD